MAIRSFATPINPTTYTKVGDNISTFSVSEHLVGQIRAVITDAGDGEPTANEANYIPFDGQFQYSGSACDIWMMSMGYDTTVYGVAE